MTAFDPLPTSQAHTTIIIIKPSLHISNPNRHHHGQRIRTTNTIPHQQNRQDPSTISTTNGPSSLPHTNLLNRIPSLLTSIISLRSDTPRRNNYQTIRDLLRIVSHRSTTDHLTTINRNQPSLSPPAPLKHTAIRLGR